jgi:hypothetical protein
MSPTSGWSTEENSCSPLRGKRGVQSWQKVVIAALAFSTLSSLSGCSTSAPVPSSTPTAVKTANPYKGGTLPAQLDGVEATPYLSLTAEVNKSLSSINKEPGVFVVMLSPGDPMKGFLVLLSSETDAAKVATQKSVKTDISGAVKTLEAPDLKKQLSQTSGLSLAGEGSQVQYVPVAKSIFAPSAASASPAPGSPTP